MRDRPDLDELDAPRVEPSKIDGLTDEEWARRRLRGETTFRAAFGAIFGCGVALLASWHWMLFDGRLVYAVGLLVAGCVVLFATLFAKRRDYDALDYAQWIGLTEWKLFEKLPMWVLLAVLAAAAAAALVLFSIVVAALFSRYA